MDTDTCACGRNITNLNKHNKQLHINTCKKRKLSSTNLKINKYFKTNSACPSTPSSHPVDSKKEKDSVTRDVSFNDDIENVVYCDNNVASCSSTPSSHSDQLTLSNDPSTFCMLTNLPHDMIEFLIQKGPMQPSRDDLPQSKFPHNKQNRSFQTNWYLKIMPGNIHVRRDWLSYSIVNDKIYCHSCIIFGRNVKKAWVKDGFSAWHKAIECMKLHEISEAHVSAALKLKLRQTALPIIPLMRENELQNTMYNREIVKALIDVSLFLAQNCVAFRGHRESWSNIGNQGNFLELTKILSKYSSPLASYLESLKNSVKKPEINFTSKLRQNQIINSISTSIKARIKEELKDAKFFSVSMDSTFDLSRKEQISFIVRYVTACGNVSERLLALHDSPITTGEQMFKIFELICKELNLDWINYLVGQSYDGAQNMRGQYNGLQTLIKEKCPTAIFVWCCAHRLNLIVSKLVSCSLDPVDLFGNLETLYNFICGSKKKVAYYEAMQKNCSLNKQGRRLKRVSTTRWMSHNYALEAVLETFEPIIDTLQHTRDTEGRDDHAVGHMAGCLMDYLLSKRFVMSAIFFQKLFNILAPLNTLLQSKDLDLLAAVNGIDEAQKKLTQVRQNDKTYDNLIHEANHFIKENNQFIFSELKINRIRKKKKMSGEMSNDEPITDPVNKFKCDTYFKCLDVTITFINNYFNAQAIGIYKDLALFSKKRIFEIKNNPSALPKDAFQEFCAVYGKCVQKDLLCKEYAHFCRIFHLFETSTFLPNELHPSNEPFETESDEDEDEDLSQRKQISTSNENSIKYVFKIFMNGQLASIFPTLNTSLLIALTLPVSSASTERSFSKLKILKSRLRTTMSQTRLEDLLIISCERDIEPNIENVIQHFKEQSIILTKHL
ncbi:hypothetical protein QTP88_000596 [Uroleucon formosanum]